jgi:hypothetical protein
MMHDPVWIECENLGMGLRRYAKGNTERLETVYRYRCPVCRHVHEHVFQFDAVVCEHERAEALTLLLRASLELDDDSPASPSPETLSDDDGDGDAVDTSTEGRDHAQPSH